MDESDRHVWTQEQVIHELEQQGVEVNSRRLTDWREHGLLPPLDERRDAHGRVTYVWTQANIVAQVATVQELFAFYGRADRFIHVLWLLGYEVRPELVMESIRAPLAVFWRFWSGGATNTDDLLESISRQAARMMRWRKNRPTTHPSEADAADHVERFLTYATFPSVPPERVLQELETESAARQARTRMGWASALAAETAQSSAQGMPPNAASVGMMRFLQQHFTLLRLAAVAKQATWEDFVQAGDDFALVREIVTAFGAQLRERQMKDTTPLMWLYLRNGALSMLGPLFILADIALRRDGHGRRVRTYLRLARRRFRNSDLSATDRDDVTELA